MVGQKKPMSQDHWYYSDFNILLPSSFGFSSFVRHISGDTFQSLPGIAIKSSLRNKYGLHLQCKREYVVTKHSMNFIRSILTCTSHPKLPSSFAKP